MTGSHPHGLGYDREHGWARIDGPQATLGITWHAQHELGEIVFVKLPATGAQIRRGDPYAEIESLKAIADAIAPLSGRVVEVNAELTDRPELLNADPYEAWIVRIEPCAPDEANGLLDADGYLQSLG